MKEKAKCRVKASVTKQDKLHFEIEHRGIEYQVRALEFQKNDRPNEINVIITGSKAVQDPEWYMPLIYKPGDRVDLKINGTVKKNMLIAAVDQKNDLPHKVRIPSDLKVSRFDTVHCIVTDVTGGVVNFEIQKAANQVVKKVAVNIDEVLGLSGFEDDEKALLKHIFESDPSFEASRQLYDNGDYNWVLSALDVVDSNIPRYIRESQLSLLEKQRWSELYNEFLVCLVESDGFMNQVSPRREGEIFNKLTGFIENAERHVSAFGLAADSERAKAFTGAVIKALKGSGHLYNGTGRLAVLRNLMRLMPEAARGYIDDILEILFEKHSDSTFIGNYRGFFTSALAEFIDSNDFGVVYEDRALIAKMLQAIGAWLLLLKEETSPEWTRRYAMLFRYAARYTHSDPATSRLLIGRAEDILINGKDLPVPFSWDDIRTPAFLCTSQLKRNLETDSDRSYKFESGSILLSVDSGRMSIGNVQEMYNEFNAFNSNLFPGQNIYVTTPTRIENRAAMGENDIAVLRRLWSEIPDALFTPAPRRVVPQIKPKPLSIGDEVDIIVTYIDNVDQKLLCQIVTPGLEGRGVTYFEEISGVDYSYLDLWQFRGETGKPLVLHTKITGRDDKEGYIFSSQTMVKDYVEGLERDLLSGQEEFMAYVGDQNEKGKWYGFSEYGFRFIFDDESMRGVEFVDGDHEEVTVNVKFVKRNSAERGFNNDNVICYARFLESNGKIPTKPFKEVLKDLTHSLFMCYTGGVEYEPNTPELPNTPKHEAQTVSAAYVHEIMKLMEDLAAVNSENYLTSYNFLSVAKLLSRIGAFSEDAGNIDVRLRLIEAISGFGSEFRIDRVKIRALISEATALEDCDSNIRSLNSILIALMSMGLPGNETEELWQRLGDGMAGRADSLLRKVMAFNVLSGVKDSAGERHALRQSIFKTANLPYHNDNAKLLGQEDLNSEYKSSLIYSNKKEDGMKPNEYSQSEAIMKVVASFLNTDGGILYIGATDTRTIGGLHNDFVYLNEGYENYDEDDMKDAFQVAFSKAVRTWFGTVTTDGVNLQERLVRGEFDYEDGKCYFKVTVLKSDRAVLFKDGRLFVRMENSTCEEKDPRRKAQYIAARSQT